MENENERDSNVCFPPQFQERQRVLEAQYEQDRKARKVLKREALAFFNNCFPAPLAALLWAVVEREIEALNPEWMTYMEELRVQDERRRRRELRSEMLIGRLRVRAQVALHEAQTSSLVALLICGGAHAIAYLAGEAPWWFPGLLDMVATGFLVAAYRAHKRFHSFKRRLRRVRRAKER